MKKLLRPAAVAITFLLTLVASIGAASACSWWFYEPEVPSKLKK